MLELAVYKISVSRVLGDCGTAVDFALLVDPAGITSPERCARYCEDTALALHGRGHRAAWSISRIRPPTSHLEAMDA